MLDLCNFGCTNLDFIKKNVIVRDLFEYVRYFIVIIL